MAVGRVQLAVLAAMLMPLAAVAAPAPTPAPAPVAGDWRGAVTGFAREHFRNPAWGASHCQRDYDLARSLAAADKVAIDDDVLFAAAWLHDMAAFKPWEDTKRDHSDVAAELMPKLLADWGFPAAKIPAVQAAIRTHMFYRAPAAPEALYLHDADALDWLGAIGVARVMALADPAGGAPDGPTVVKLLESNLKDVPARVLSPAGQARMPALRDELATFLTNLKRETADLKTL